jgi:hypothetical protein
MANSFSRMMTGPGMAKLSSAPTPVRLTGAASGSYAGQVDGEYEHVVPVMAPPSETCETKEADVPRSFKLARSIAVRGMGKKPLRAFLSYYANQAGAANTAFSWQYQLRPDLDSSWSSWASVFDECRVVSARVHWSAWFNTLPSAFSGQSPNAVVVYEPEDATTLSAVNAGLEYERYQLLAVGANASGTYAVTPQAVAGGGSNVNAYGLCTFDAHIPQGGAQSSRIDTYLSTGQWRPTGDSTPYYWGSFLGYCAAGGASSVIQIQAFIRMEVEFRVRR